MKAQPGTYTLILHSASPGEVQVGRWGRLTVEPGYYLYVGSALGPGGVRARVMRHFRECKPRHWHIDYLCEKAQPVCAWYRYGTTNREHRWARAVAGMAQTTPVPGFGCSDCRCEAHLFVVGTRPAFERFCSAVGGAVGRWPADGA